MKFNIKKIIIILLFSSALLAGTIFLFLGIKETVSLAVKQRIGSMRRGIFVITVFMTLTMTAKPHIALNTCFIPVERNIL